MEYTKQKIFNDKGGASENKIYNSNKFPNWNFTSVVKPNVDTYYSTCFFNLTKEPIILSLPKTDRYYLMPIMDAYSNVFFSPGTRTTGNQEQHFLIAGPDWRGKTPKGIELVHSPTNMAMLIGRTKVLNKEDGASVVSKKQSQYTTIPLSEFGNSSYKFPVKMFSDVPNTAPVNRLKDLKCS